MLISLDFGCVNIPEEYGVVIFISHYPLVVIDIFDY